MAAWVWRVDIKASKQEYLKWGEKGVSNGKYTEVKTIMREECCGDIWSHKHYLFCVQLSIHHLSKVKRPPEKKAAWLRELLAVFLCRENQGHNINLQTSPWSLSLPSLVFLRLFHLLLGEWHCVKLFLLSFFLYGWQKNIQDKIPPQSSDLDISPNIPWTAVWTSAHVLARNDRTSKDQHLKTAFPGARWIWAPRERQEGHNKAVSVLSHGR